VRAVCVELEGELAVFVVNDALEARPGILRYGLFGLAGGRPVDETIEVDCPANAAVRVAGLPLSVWDDAGTDAHGAFAILSGAGGEQSTHRLFRRRFRELAWSGAEVSVSRRGGKLRLCCDRFAWAVCLDADGERALADNYFDLIPGIERVISWPADAPTPTPRAANPRGGGWS
jgi:hypothetical protein